MTHANRWRTVLAAGVVCIGLAVGTRGARAQSDWVIKPGEGLGPVLLGMTEDQVHAYLKHPTAVQFVGEFKGEDFPNLSVTYKRDHGSRPFSVSGIDITGGRNATDRGIRIGSSVFDVVGAYGGSAANFVRQHHGVSLVGCLGLALNPGDKSGLSLAFVYKNLGITFDTVIPRRGGPVNVTGITIFHPQRCGE